MTRAPVFVSLIQCSSLVASTKLGASPSLGVGDLYQILGVPSDASDEETRAALRHLAKELHPDVHPGDEAVEPQFRAVLTAYETFKHARRAYRRSVTLRRRRF